MNVLSRILAASCLFALTAVGQGNKAAFPDGLYSAKTIAVINDTRTPQVDKGAEEALKNWGQFKLVDDPQVADVTLRFEKTRQHEGHDSQKQDPNGKDSSYSYSMSFSSTIEVKAFYKDADTPFYTTKTEDSRARAGTTCVNSFHTAFRQAHQPATP